MAHKVRLFLRFPGFFPRWPSGSYLHAGKAAPLRGFAQKGRLVCWQVSHFRIFEVCYFYNYESSYLTAPKTIIAWIVIWQVNWRGDNAPSTVSSVLRTHGRTHLYSLKAFGICLALHWINATYSRVPNETTDCHLSCCSRFLERLRHSQHYAVRRTRSFCSACRSDTERQWRLR